MTEPDIHLVDEYAPAGIDDELLAHIHAHPERVYQLGSELCKTCLIPIEYGSVCGCCGRPMPYPHPAGRAA